MNLRNGKVTGTISEIPTSNDIDIDFDDLTRQNEAFFRKMPVYLSIVEKDLRSFVINLRLELDKMKILSYTTEERFKNSIIIYKMIRNNLYFIKIIGGSFMNMVIQKNDYLIEEANHFIRDNPTNQIIITYAEEFIDIVNDVKYMLLFRFYILYFIFVYIFLCYICTPFEYNIVWMIFFFLSWIYYCFYYYFIAWVYQKYTIICSGLWTYRTI